MYQRARAVSVGLHTAVGVYIRGWRGRGRGRGRFGRESGEGKLRGIPAVVDRMMPTASVVEVVSTASGNIHQMEGTLQHLTIP